MHIDKPILNLFCRVLYLLR